jgi:large-conductance mechanosensitive channel
MAITFAGDAKKNMRNFLKNYGIQIGILINLIVIASVVFGAGKICNRQDRIIKDVELKLDKEIYYREFSQIDKRLQRIEEKLDAVLADHKAGIGGPGR